MKQFKKALSVFLQLVLILSAFSVLPVSAARLDESVQDSTAMGKDIQWIVDEAQLRDLAERVNNGETMEGKNFTLGEDITLTQDWTPIGTSDHPFKGTFDGFQGIISGLKVSQDDDCSGLFGYNMGVIMNVNVEVETLSGKEMLCVIPVGWETAGNPALT